MFRSRTGSPLPYLLDHLEHRAGKILVQNEVVEPQHDKLNTDAYKQKTEYVRQDRDTVVPEQVFHAPGDPQQDVGNDGDYYDTERLAHVFESRIGVGSHTDRHGYRPGPAQHRHGYGGERDIVVSRYHPGPLKLWFPVLGIQHPEAYIRDNDPSGYAYSGQGNAEKFHYQNPGNEEYDQDGRHVNGREQRLPVPFAVVHILRERDERHGDGERVHYGEERDDRSEE